MGLFQYFTILILALGWMAAEPAMGADNRRLVHQGRVLKPDGSPLEGSFQVEAKIYSPAPGVCLLWGESKTVGFSRGAFSMEIGDSLYRMTGSSSGRSVNFPSVFINNAAYNLTGADCQSGTVYNPASTDDRTLVVTLYNGPQVVKIYEGAIRSVPYAIESHNASMVGGYDASHIFKFNETGSHKPSLTFSTLGASFLWELAESSNFSGRRLTGLGDPTSPTDAVNLQSMNAAIASAISGGTVGGGMVTSIDAVSAQTGVMNITGGPITSQGTFSFSFVSQTANTVFAAPTGSAGIPSFRALEASDIPNLDAAKITSGTLPVSRGGTGLSSFTPYALLASNMTGDALVQWTCSNGEVLVWQSGSGWACEAKTSGSGSMSYLDFTASTIFSVTGGPVTTTGTIDLSLASQAQGLVLASPTGASGVPTFRALSGTDLPVLAGTGVTLSLTGGSLQISAAGSGGTVSEVTAGTGLLGGSITSAGTLSVDVGLTDGKIVQVGAGDKIPVALIPNLDASIITTGTLSAARGGTGLDASAAADGQLLIGNGTGFSLNTLTAGTGISIVNTAGSISISSTLGGGTVTNVGLTAPTSVFSVTGSPVTGAGTMVVDFTAQNAATVFAAPTGASGQPTFRALAGSDLPILAGTGVSVNLTGGSLEISSTLAGGTVTQITAGTGLLGGAITSSGTVSVDVGLTDGKIVQVGSGDKIPVALIPNLDASIITTGTLGAARGGTGLDASSAADGQILIGNGTGFSLNTLTAGTGISIVNTAGSISISSTLGGGTVTNVGLTAPTSVFSVTGSPVTGAGTMVVDFTAQNAATVFAAPTGASGQPTFRALEASDIPGLDASKIVSGTLGVDRGGTGLVPTAGDANKVYGLDATGLASEFKSLVAGTGVTIDTSTPGAISISAAGSGGTVTNIGALVPSYMTVSPAAITSSGTFDFSFNSQNAAMVFASPTGSTGAPTFRALAASDIPALDASKITSGTLSVSLGGTGLGSYTPYALFASNMTGDAIEQRICSAGQVLVWQVATGWTCGAGGASEIASGTLGTAFGGTGLDASAAANGQLLIGNGTGFSLNTLTAGTGISITNTAGSISISAVAGTTGLSQWSNNSQGINYSSGSVGIGTAAPENMLHIANNVNADTGLTITNMTTGNAAGSNIWFEGDNQVMGNIGYSSTANPDAAWAGRVALTSSVTSGGISLVAGFANFGDIRMYTGGPNERLRIDNLGNIGIGTASPTAILDVASNGTLGSAIRIPRDTTANRPSAAAVGMMRYNTTDNKYEVYETTGWASLSTSSGTASASLSFPLLATSDGSASAPAYSFASESSLGMYRSAANELSFAVNGTIWSLTDAGFYTNISNGPGMWSGGPTQFQVRSTSEDGIGTGGNGILNLVTASTTRMTIDPNGQVGVGTTSPTAIMDLASNGTLGSALRLPRDTTANRPAAPGLGMIRYNTTDNKYEVYESAGWASLATGSTGSSQWTAATGGINYASGNVGIGTTAPTGFGTAGPILHIKSSGSNAPEINLDAKAGGGHEWVLVSDPDTSFGIYDKDRAGYALWTNGWSVSVDALMAYNGVYGSNDPSDDLILDSTWQAAKGNVLIAPNGGRVGVGTISPTVGLDIATTGTTGSAIRIPRDSTANRPVGNAAALQGMIRYNTTDNKYEVYESTGWASLSTSSGTAAGDFKADGSVPMTGTIKAANGTESLPSVTFASDPDNGMFLSGANAIGFATQGVEHFTITSSGNAIVPDGYLSAEYSNSSGIAQALTVGNTSSPAANNGSSIAYFGGGSPMAIVGSQWDAANNDNAYYTISTTTADVVTEKLRVTSTGKVGIGTSSPTAGLDISTTGTLGSAIRIPRDTTANRPSAAAVGMMRYNTSDNKYEVYESAGWASLSTSSGTAGASQWSNNSQGINYSSGSVGIGTATPGNTLSVVGTFHATDGSNADMFFDWGSQYAPFNVTSWSSPSAYFRSESASTSSVQPALFLGAKGLGGTAAPGLGTGIQFIGDTNAGTVNFNPMASISAIWTGSTLTSADHSGALAFSTVHRGNAAATPTERLRVSSEGHVGIGTTSPTAILDIASNGTLGSALRLPRDTTANRPTTAGLGMIRYNTTDNKYEVYESAGWASLSTSSGTAGASQWQSVASGIYYNSGSVGIGTNSPNTNLTVQNLNSSTTLTNFTESLTNGGINVVSNYTSDDRYTPGIFWSTADNNPTKPKAGVWTQNTNAGSALYFGATNAYGTGINRTMYLDGLGVLNTFQVSTGQVQAEEDDFSPGIFTRTTMANTPDIVATFIRRRADLGAFTTAMEGVLLFETQDHGTSEAGSAGLRWGWENTQTNGTTDRDGYLSFTTTQDNGSSTLGGTEKMRITSSGRVGIGTTSPTTGLDVATTGTLGSALRLPRDTTANRPSTAGLGMIRYNTTDNKYEVYESAGWASLSTSSGTAAASQWSNNSQGIHYSSGSVGIGTATPAAMLDMRGTNPQIKIVRTADSPVFMNVTPDASNRYAEIAFENPSDSTTFATIGAYLGHSGEVSYAYLNSGTTSINVTGSNGGPAQTRNKFGFDVYLPTRYISLNGDGNRTLGMENFSTASSAGGSLTINAGGSGTNSNLNGGSLILMSGDATGNGSSDIQFKTVKSNQGSGTTVRTPATSMIISSNAQVGIGTSTPTAILDLGTNGTLGSALRLPQDTTANRPTVSAVGMIRYNTTDSKYEVYQTTGWASLATGTVGMGDFKADGSVPMTGALRASNGTDTLPAYSFANDTDTGFYLNAANEIGLVNGGITMGYFSLNGFSMYGQITAGMAVQAPSSPPYAFFNDTNTGLYSPAGDTIGFATNSTEKMRLDSSGRLGIGTTTPSVALDVVATGTLGSAIRFPRATTAMRPVGSAAGDLQGMMRYNTDLHKYEVYEGTTGWASLSTSSGTAGASQWTSNATGIYYSGGSVGIGTASPANALDINGAASIGYPATAAPTNGLIVAGDTGIGRNNPAYQLDVVGNSGEAGARIQGNASSDTLAPSLVLDVNRSSAGGTGLGNYIEFQMRSSSTFGATAGQFGAVWTDATHATRSAAFVFNPVSNGTVTERMRIASSGNVGIGTSSPSGNLEVSAADASTELRIVNTTSSATRSPKLSIRNYRNGQANGNPEIQLLNGGGTQTTTAALASGDRLGLISFAGTYNTAGGYASGADILAEAEGAYASTSTPGRIIFRTTAGASTSPTERVRIDSSGFVGIGTTSPTQTLHIVGASGTTLKIVDGNQGAGKVLTSDANGVASWATAGGGSSTIDGLTDGKTTGGTEVLFLGTNVGQSSTGAYNTAVGQDSFQDNTTGENNSAFGTSALANSTTGNLNTAVGVDAMYTNTTGYQNVAVGASALSTGTSSILNTAVGTYSMTAATGGSYNAALGASALGNMTSGSYNTAIGSGAGNGAGPLSYNVFIGSNAGTNANGADYNVVIGYGAAGSLTSGDGNILIGSVDVPTGTTSNSINIGNTIYGNTSTGNIAIGTSGVSANTKLYVNGQIASSSGTNSNGVIDFSAGNSISSSFDCGSNLSLANVRNGGTYILVITGTGTSTCNFPASTSGDDAASVTYKWQSPNAARTASTHTMYTLVRVGNVIYVSWATGFQ